MKTVLKIRRAFLEFVLTRLISLSVFLSYWVRWALLRTFRLDTALLRLTGRLLELRDRLTSQDKR